MTVPPNGLRVSRAAEGGVGSSRLLGEPALGKCLCCERKQPRDVLFLVRWQFLPLKYHSHLRSRAKKISTSFGSPNRLIKAISMR
jgi:murein endopeptidase